MFKYIMNILFSLLLILLVMARPIVMKKAAKNFSAKTSTIFTAFWSVILLLILLPFIYNNINFSINIGIFGSIVKGFSLFQTIRNSQVLNKESTSAAVFWGPTSICIASIVNILFFKEVLSITQFITIFVLFLIACLFFIVGDGKKLSSVAKKAFLYINIAVVINLVCDKFALSNINWYLHILISYLSMLFCSFVSGVKKEDIINCIKNRSCCMAGVVYGIGEIVIILTMQTIFNNNIIKTVFLIRIAQAIDLIIAHYMYKENKISLQYIFAISQIIACYFFYFLK